MKDISIRIVGKAGRITLQRPEALNAMTYKMCASIESALNEWRALENVKVVVIDAVGEKAFCAGGDVTQLYKTGIERNFRFGQKFWADEYRMNATIANYPKPYVSLMQGFTMGGGVGLGCHGSHRIVSENSLIAMPECGIGLVPDVGGSFILARAPGAIGQYLALTGARMGPADAIFAGFSDFFIPQKEWPLLISELEKSGNTNTINRFIKNPPKGTLEELLPFTNDIFSTNDLIEIEHKLMGTHEKLKANIEKAFLSNSPLSMACTLRILESIRRHNKSLVESLELEYRFVARSMEYGDFLEGIRAAIIDKDKKPNWKYSLRNVPTEVISMMLAPKKHQGLTNSGDIE